jgi:uncharacterized protein YjeT (DUF2065 family)
MRLFLYTISLFYITYGCFSILYTDETQKFVRSLFKDLDQKILSALPFIFGILFILSASATSLSWFFRFIGLMAVIEGVIFFIMPKELYDKFMDWYLKLLSDQIYRLFGIIGIIFGIAILSWIL